MTEASDVPKRRRGRPRLASDDKKRRNMTFRVRDELRAAVEELAQANGRSLSEQIEYYVEASVSSEVGLTYKYSTDALSPTLFRALTAPGAPKGPSLSVSFPKEHGEMLTIAGKNYINPPMASAPLPWVAQHGGHEGAVAMARAFLNSTVRGALEAFEATLGPAVVAALWDDGTVEQGGLIPRPEQPQTALAERCVKAETEVAQLRAELSSFLGDPQASEAIKTEFERIIGAKLSVASSSISVQDARHGLTKWLKDFERAHQRELKFTLPAFAALLNQIDLASPDLSVLYSSGWPRRLAALPSTTMLKLVNIFGEDAHQLYWSLMRPPRHDPKYKNMNIDYEITCRAEALDALRLMREAFERENLGSDVDLRAARGA